LNRRRSFVSATKYANNLDNPKSSNRPRQVYLTMEDSEEYSTVDTSDVILILDASHWNSSDDIYDSFFEAVGAPSWHGRNLDALNDSIAVGCINLIETPYTLIIKNYGKMGYGAREMAKRFVDFIGELEESGTPVSIQIEG